MRKNIEKFTLLLFPSPYGVSFILIKKRCSNRAKHNVGFRLLTEYHSFLFNKCFNWNYYRGSQSFRLLTEYHSFLLKDEIVTVVDKEYKFPSPYGVSFILIKQKLIF